MEFVPHNYQQRAIDIILQKPKCALMLGLGMGKTVITLKALSDLLDDFSIHRVLIIAPLYVASDVWTREAKKWDFAKDLKIDVAVGSVTQRRKAIEGNAPIVTINRENVIWLVDNYGTHFPFDCIVIDESSSFKSYSSKRFKKLRAVSRNMRRMIELTGTPRPRSIEDLWSQIYLLDKGDRLEKSMTAFRTKYEVPGRRNGYQVYDWVLREGSEDEIYRRIEDITVSMKAEDWLDVPDMTVIDHFTQLDTKDKEIYKQLCRDAITQIEEETVVGVNAGSLCGKLLQLSNGAVYNEDGGVTHFHDKKLDVLEEIVESTEEPIMVFYWFKHDYERLMKRFEKYEPRTITQSSDISDWNDGKIRLLFVHPASMGHGLNLQEGGHIIVWFGLTWSLEIYQQANARLHRQGQKNKVQVHRIITQDTADEQVVASLNDKNKGQENLLDAIKLHLLEKIK